MQGVRHDKWQPCQHAGVDAVAFGMALVDAAHVGNLLAIDAIDIDVVALQVLTCCIPGYTGGFQYSLEAHWP